MKHAAMTAAVLAAVLLLAASVAAEAYTHFEVVSYSWSSRTGGKVYPGSKNAVLTVTLKYLGNETLEDVTGCISLPQGFKPSAGYGTCIPAYSGDGVVKTRVQPGDTLVFRFHIDVDRSVKPGTYSIDFHASFYSVDRKSTGDSGVIVFQVNVSRYPPLSLAFVEAYWEPGGYVGVEGATLHIVLRYYGDDARLLEGRVRVWFENSDAFRPSVFRYRIGGAEHGDYVYIDVRGVSIRPTAKPGYYRVFVEINATCETSDGVRYEDSEVLGFRVQVLQPPRIMPRVLDYGFEGIVEPGSYNAVLYVTLLQDEPGVSIEAVVARAELHGAIYANGSHVGVYTSTLNARYGDVFTLRFQGLNVTSWRVEARLEVNILVNDGGSRYWSSVEYNLTIQLEPHPLRLKPLRVWWDGGVAYPGSQGLTLRVALANMDYRSVEGGVAILELPRGFEPRNITVELPRIREGDSIVIAFNGISILSSVKPGWWRANLTLLVVVSGGAYQEVRVEAPLLVHVDSLNHSLVALAALGWDEGVAFPNETGASLRFVVYQPMPGYRVDSLMLHVILPQCIKLGDSSIYNVSLERLGYGEYREITLSGLRVECRPGLYPVAVIAKGLASRGSASTWFNETVIAMIPVSRPSLEFSLLGYEWAEGGYPGSRASRLRLYLAYLSPWDLDTLILVARVTKGGVLEGGSAIAQYNSVARGSSVLLEVSGLTMNSTRLVLELEAIGVVRLGSARAIVNRSMRLVIPARNETIVSQALRVTSVSVLYNGEPALLVQGARGSVVRVWLLNTAPYRVSSISAILTAHGLSVKSVTGSCLEGVAPGAQCYLDFTVWVSEDAKPGLHNATLRLLYVVSQGSSLTLLSQNMSIPLEVLPISSVVPRLVVISAYWERGVPYPEAGERSLGVTVLNAGRWSASGVHVLIRRVESAGVKPLVDSSACATSLAPGAYCTATFRLLVGEVNTSRITLYIEVRQVVRVYGANAIVSRVFRVSLPVAAPPLPRVTLGDHGWLNGWHVFPGTRDATYRVVIGATYPLPLSGIEAWLEAPCIDSRRVYAAGPIQPYSSVELRIPVDVEACAKPGMLNATLVLVYTINSPGVEWRHVERIPVTLRIDEISSAVSIVKAYWVGGAVRPGYAGADLRIILRNNLVDEMRGAVLYARLPRGMWDAALNASVAVAIPGEAQQEPLPESSIDGGARLVEALLRAGNLEATLPVLPLGSFITLDLDLNLGALKPGYYNITLELDFIDAWGSRHVWRGYARVYVAGAPVLILVESPSVLSIANGIARMELTIRNVGSGPILDAYLYVIPRVPLLVPNQSVVYIGRLDANESRSYTLTLYYNPAGLTSWSGSSTSYATIVFTYTLLYHDANGVLHVYNFTRGAQLLPFIELRLGPDTRAEQRGTSLTVGGTLINTGISTARSVTIEAVASNARSVSFVGDIEPGDQVAFRVDLETGTRVETVTLVIQYLDDYGRRYELNYTLPVYHVEVNTTIISEKSDNLATRVIQAVLITSPIVALATGYLVYRLHRRRVGA